MKNGERGLGIQNKKEQLEGRNAQEEKQNAYINDDAMMIVITATGRGRRRRRGGGR